MQRLQKIIANSGFTSRRKAEQLIEQGSVKLNGIPAKLGDKATNQDKITINDSPLPQKPQEETYILNKPKGILTTKHDPQNRQTIYDLPALKNFQHLKYVGRLDGMSEGLLLLTTSGDLIQSLTHPSKKISKVYHIRTDPIITKKDAEKLSNGILIENKKFQAKITNKNNNEFDITIQEGRNRIIRKAMEKLNYKIYQLKRTQIANIKLPQDLKPGQIQKIQK